MPDIFERLKQLKAPDRVCDALIFKAIGAPLPKAIANTAIALEWDEKEECYLANLGEMRARYEVPAYTASLDAALTLVPDGAKVSLEIASYQTAAWVHNPGRPVNSCYGEVRPPAIALCIAALGARHIAK
jgi:hypothetical protein